MTKDGEFVPLARGSQAPGIPGGQDNRARRNPALVNAASRRRIPFSHPAEVTRHCSSRRGRGGRRHLPASASKSEETSIRSYRGATRYDQWMFTFNVAPRPGGAMPLANSPDGRGGDPNNPMGPGGFPQRGNTGRAWLRPGRRRRSGRRPWRWWSARRISAANPTARRRKPRRHTWRPRTRPLAAFSPSRNQSPYQSAYVVPSRAVPWAPLLTS